MPAGSGCRCHSATSCGNDSLETSRGVKERRIASPIRMCVHLPPRTADCNSASARTLAVIEQIKALDAGSFARSACKRASLSSPDSELFIKRRRMAGSRLNIPYPYYDASAPQTALFWDYSLVAACGKTGVWCDLGFFGFPRDRLTIGSSQAKHRRKCQIQIGTDGIAILFRLRHILLLTLSQTVPTKVETASRGHTHPRLYCCSCLTCYIKWSHSFQCHD